MILAIIAALAAAAVTVPADAATGLVISGRVVDANGNGIQDVTVLADWYSTAEGQWREDDGAMTDIDGNYSVKLTNRGSYKVHFVGYNFLANEYAPTWYPGVERMTDATVLKVSTSSLRNIDVTMTRGAVISGQVLQPDGTPVPTGTSIQAFPASGDPEQVSSDWGYLWSTVQGGYYSFPGLRAGTYRVQAAGTQDGAPTWLGQTSYFDTSATVSVAPGEVKGGNDITLLVPGTMAGRVLHPTTANARPPVRITLFDPYGHRVRSTEADADGQWSLEGLAPADYRVAFYADNAYLEQWYGPSKTASGSPLFTVQSGTTTTVDYRLVYSSLKIVTRPRILGTRKVWRILEATDGTWNHKPSHVAYRWYRNGKPITGATRHTYKLRSADAGRRISVRVTAYRTSYEPGSAMSASTSTIRR